MVSQYIAITEKSVTLFWNSTGASKQEVNEMSLFLFCTEKNPEDVSYQMAVQNM